MIPISDDNPARRRARVNWAIIGICIAIYIWELSQGSQFESVLEVLGFAPASLHERLLPPPGYIALSPYLTILTAMFVHGSILHIGGNMLYLWIFGNNVEDAMGHLRYVAFYLLSGIGAACAFAFMDPNSNAPMIGASGAISGVLAAYVLMWPRARVTVIIPLGIIFYPLNIGAAWVIGFWFALQLFSVLFTSLVEPGVAWWAHVGGFVTGLMLTPLFKSRDVPLLGDVHRGPWQR